MALDVVGKNRLIPITYEQANQPHATAKLWQIDLHNPGWPTHQNALKLV